jgi:hypothetical protein
MNLQSLVKTALYRLGYSIKRIRPARTPRGTPSAPGAPVTHASLLALLHKRDPYDGFDFAALPLDAHGWGSESPAFREIILAQKPNLIVEVGTWKGGSALQMAGILEETRLPGTILCIDTWLGALEFWTDLDDPDRYKSLRLKHGYPSVYYQFLANVCHRGMQRRIVPFPQTSAIGALWLRYFGLLGNLIYIDGSHEEDDVYQDLADYWEVLAPGGTIFGDDYTWDGVRIAVERFAREQRLRVEFLADKWLLRKKS